jgi:hypothetical protein
MEIKLNGNGKERIYTMTKEQGDFYVREMMESWMIGFIHFHPNEKDSVIVLEAMRDYVNDMLEQMRKEL